MFCSSSCMYLLIRQSSEPFSLLLRELQNSLSLFSSNQFEHLTATTVSLNEWILVSLSVMCLWDLLETTVNTVGFSKEKRLSRESWEACFLSFREWGNKKLSVMSFMAWRDEYIAIAKLPLMEITVQGFESLHFCSRSQERNTNKERGNAMFHLWFLALEDMKARRLVVNSIVLMALQWHYILLTLMLSLLVAVFSFIL